MNGIGISIVKDRSNPGFIVRYYTGAREDYEVYDGDSGLFVALDKVNPDRHLRGIWIYKVLTVQNRLLSELDDPHGAVVEVLFDTTHDFHFLVGRAPGPEVRLVGTMDEVVAAMPAAERPSADYDPVELGLSIHARVGALADDGFYESDAPREGLQKAEVSKASRSERTVFDDIVEAPAGTSIVELWRFAKIDPRKDLAFSDWSDVDFGDADLSGCNFEGANLSDSDFSRAKIDGMNYDGANITGAKWPTGYIPDADGEGTWTM
ncbi:MULTISPECIES: pentapeptide repeat-containing protein [unclassified Rhizobium]|uniref:pentapeptide repeat-containing protein n=1 Tax=Rhizobium sp. 16-488-2a TaxID=2819990 RepID=UPI001ADB1EA2|nr:pentapeptide repeat-containing protein [Rhizobium sp. 16-488-2a]